MSSGRDINAFSSVHGSSAPWTGDADLRVLVLAPTGRDAPLTCEMLQQAGVECTVCQDVLDLSFKIGDGVGAMVIAEEALTPRDTRMLFERLANEPPWSDPPIIVLTHRVGDSQASQRTVQLLGAHSNVTLLERPVRTVTLLTAMHSALRARRRQYEVRELLARLQKGVQDRDRFLAMLGHELRNPLGTILTSIEIINRGGGGGDGGGDAPHSGEAEDADSLKQQRGIIARQTRHLARLVDDLLDVSRVSAGKIHLQMARVDLTEIARRAVAAIRSLAAARSHDVHVIAPDRPVLVSGDAVRLEQIVNNLLTNAIKYTQTGGRIELRLGSENDQAVLRLRDNGIGIAADALPRLFDVFMQVDNSLDRTMGGLGLGLTLVRSLVEMHGGTVSAASEGLDRGSEFTVRLPLCQDVPEVSSAPAAASEDSRIRVTSDAAAPGRKYRVLLVEDSVDGRLVMEKLIRLWGHDVDVAENGAVGVQKALANKPDIALVDIGLPVLDGYQVARKIRAELGDSVYLVALTGYGQNEDRERAHASGFDMHLVKPVEPARLRMLLSDAPVHTVTQPGATATSPSA